MKWTRHRFKTMSAGDPRPLVFNSSYPWWCSGSGDTRDGYEFAVIVAFLPEGEPLEKYWDDAYDVESAECDGPTFTDRFARPRWYKPLGEVQP